MLRARVQAHPAITPLRKRIAAALDRLPELNANQTEKLATLTRRMLGMKMPTRVVMLQRGHYAVRPCVSGIVFTAAVFQSLGGPENHKLVAPMTRLADAISYHFRDSRLRGGTKYNFDVEQAKSDDAVLYPELEALSTILVECGVPVIHNVKWDTTQCEPKDFYEGARIEELEKRIEALERTVKVHESVVSLVGQHQTQIETLETKTAPVIGIPSGF